MPGSVLFLLAVMIHPSYFPPPHELDPVEGRTPVPALDENRAPEARTGQRQLSPFRTAVGVPIGAARSRSSKIPHHSPSEDGDLSGSTGIPTFFHRSVARYTEHAAQTSNFSVEIIGKQEIPTVLNCLK